MYVDVHLELSPSVGNPFRRHENNHFGRSEVPMKLCEHSDVPTKRQYEYSDVLMKLPYFFYFFLKSSGGRVKIKLIAPLIMLVTLLTSFFLGWGVRRFHTNIYLVYICTYVDPGSIQGSHRPISFIRTKHRTRANVFF